MSIYIIILLLMNIGFFLDFTNFKLKRYLFLFNLLIIFLLASFRYMIGPDYKAYYEMFLNIQNYDFFTTYMFKGTEIGYWYLTYFIEKITEFQVIVFIMNFMIFYFFYRSIKKEKYKNVSILILYSLFYMYSIFSTYRQGLVMFIFLYNLENIWNKKLKRYIMFAVFGGLFHLTSFLTIPLYLILNKKYKIRAYILILCLSIIISRPEILNFLARLIVNNFDNVLSKKINMYFFIKSNSEISKISLFAWINRSLQLGWLSLFYYLKKREMSSKENVIFNAVYLTIISFVILSPIGVVAGRVSDVFEVALILFIPLLLSVIKHKKNRMILIIQFLIYLNLFFVKELNSNHGSQEIKDYLPYKSIFNKE